MSRLIVCLFVLLVSLGVTPVTAQEDSMLSECTVAQKGDSFWRIANYHLTADQWKVLWAKNPTTPEGKARHFFKKPENGFSYVYLGVGEVICGLKEAGVVPTIATPTELAGMGLLKTVTETKEITPNWFWWLLFLVTFLALVALYNAYGNSQTLRMTEDARRRESERATQEINRVRHEMARRREPEQLGTPVVPGGIQPTETERLQGFFHEQAVSAYVARHPELGRSRDTVRPTLIGQIEHGMLSGEGQVRDLDGNWHDSLIEAPGRPGYQARFRYPDGTEELMQSYQACMNPVRSGEGMRGFVFVPNTPEPAPVPSPAATQTTPTPEHTPGVGANADAPQVSRSNLTFEMKRSSNREPHLVRFDSDQVDEFFIGRDKRIIIRYRDEDQVTK